MNATHLQELLTIKLDKPIDDWVEEQRVAGMSWHQLSAELYAISGVRTTPETLRRWYRKPTAA